MIAPPIHECPICGGAFDVGNSSYEEHKCYTDFFFLCDFCHRGWEISLCDDDGRFEMDYYEKTEPVNFGQFVRRLEAARAA